MGFASGLTRDTGLRRDALAFGSGLKPDVDSCRWHSLQESAKSRPMRPERSVAPSEPVSRTSLSAISDAAAILPG